MHTKDFEDSRPGCEDAQVAEWEREQKRQNEIDARISSPDFQAQKTAWIERYVTSMLALGSQQSESALRCRAEEMVDATAADGDMTGMESPELIAEEEFEYEQDALPINPSIPPLGLPR